LHCACTLRTHAHVKGGLTVLPSWTRTRRPWVGQISTSPNGAKWHSLGQRPRNGGVTRSKALKGRNNPPWDHSFRPFRAPHGSSLPCPGRCPALYDHAPLGRKTDSRRTATDPSAASHHNRSPSP